MRLRARGSGRARGRLTGIFSFRRTARRSALTRLRPIPGRRISCGRIKASRFWTAEAAKAKVFCSPSAFFGRDDASRRPRDAPSADSSRRATERLRAEDFGAGGRDARPTARASVRAHRARDGSARRGPGGKECPRGRPQRAGNRRPPLHHEAAPALRRPPLISGASGRGLRLSSATDLPGSHGLPLRRATQLRPDRPESPRPETPHGPDPRTRPAGAQALRTGRPPAPGIGISLGGRCSRDARRFGIRHGPSPRRARSVLATNGRRTDQRLIAGGA